MPKKSKKPEPIPCHFQNIAEAAAFWDDHDLIDYWDLTREVDCKVDLQRRTFVTVLDSELARKLTVCARPQGLFNRDAYQCVVDGRSGSGGTE